MKKTNTLNYDVYATPNPDANGEQLYHVRPVTLGSTTSEEDLKDYLERNTRVNKSQFEGVVQALKDEIPQQLLSNKRVHIKGMGTFYLQLGIRRRKDAQGRLYRPKFKDPKDITARDVCVEGIGFRADPSWNRVVKYSKQPFDRSPHTVHAQEIEVGRLLVWIDAQMKERGGVVVKDVCRKYATTVNHARKLLNSLCEGSQPKLYREKVGATYFYKRWGKS